jgi:uncharacterized repeat protein (TIGR03803 family)
MRRYRQILSLAVCIAGVSCSSSASGSDRPVPAPDAVRPRATERVVYSFAGGSDGNAPSASLIAVNGELYGTTGGGGGSGCTAGCGTIFKVSASGQESVLHAFTGGSDGEIPSGPLTYVHGKLYGMTEFGGGTGCKQRGTHLKGCGTIFEVGLSGAERVLYHFSGGKEEAFPTGGLTYVNGAFYGEAAGGINGLACLGTNPDTCGTIFKMTPSGQASVLYAFTGREQGAFPQGGLLFFGGNFYGTTGSKLFEVSPSGAQSTLHTFASSPNGVIALNGDLYGVVPSGGRHTCFGASYYFPCGAVFRAALTGRESDIYNFQGGMDGATPTQLIAVAGDLFGTTFLGGKGCNSPAACGTVFELTPTGQETVLYRFHGPDGSSPLAGLLDVSGTFYGTTALGGSHNYGTVFAITP